MDAKSHDLQLNLEDLQQIESHGLSLSDIEAQLEIFRKGLPPVELVRPATPGDGIHKINPEDFTLLLEEHQAAAKSGRFMKFVPASGSATRMFKKPLAAWNERERLRNGDTAAESSRKFLEDFFENLPRFAFYDDLENHFRQLRKALPAQFSVPSAIEILEILLFEKGLNYARLPKGLIPFHRYPEGSRTAFLEHLVEGMDYASDAAGNCRLHFTVAPEHRQRIREHLESAAKTLRDAGNTFQIDYSIQKPSTNTIAVDLNNRLFRDEAGKILFRPGGHGALLENLNELQGDLIYIKNIDNVQPDHLKSTTFLYKRLLGGFLVQLQRKVHSYLKKLSGETPSPAVLAEISEFAKKQFGIVPPANLSIKAGELGKFLFERLNRPIRVGGMVRNTGEPGGGPFWVKSPDGSVSLQVVESAQMNLADPRQKSIMEQATHFSPVDFVCAVRGFEGKAFNLLDFRDPEAAFITRKSQNGRDLKALELPGLWNGGMAKWLTVFVEVPLETFTPVKEVMDLLRPEHQPAG
ncbi:MAG: DUF4301 family protein [Calditrichia bacterium]